MAIRRRIRRRPLPLEPLPIADGPSRRRGCRLTGGCTTRLWQRAGTGHIRLRSFDCCSVCNNHRSRWACRLPKDPRVAATLRRISTRVAPPSTCSIMIAIMLSVAPPSTCSITSITAFSGTSFDLLDAASFAADLNESAPTLNESDAPRHQELDSTRPRAAAAPTMLLKVTAPGERPESDRWCLLVPDLVVSVPDLALSLEQSPCEIRRRERGERWPVSGKAFRRRV